MALSNSQFDAIMRVYNQRQFLNKRRQEDVYKRQAFMMNLARFSFSSK